mgnify:FL=1
MNSLTHFDNQGNANMVNVSDKNHTKRIAEASGIVEMNPSTLITIVNKKISKGDVFQIARLAGIMSAKKTSEIIPLCHPIIIDSIDLYLDPQKDKKSIIIKSKVICRGPTGVEMEALTAVSSAALTIYDMCKSIDRGIKIKNIQLLKKSGGKSGTWTAENE